MSEIAEISLKLEELPGLIEAQGEKVIQARKEYLIAKANYENVYHRTILEKKLVDANATQTDLKALAITTSMNERIEMIKKESTYKRKQKDLAKLRDDLDITKEMSYNYRQELKNFRG